MLTPDYLKNVADDAVNVYAKLENSIIKDIVRRLQDTDFQMTESARFQIQIAQESGMLYDDIIKKVAEYSQNSEKVIKKTFENSAIEALKFDDMIYIAQGLSPIPIKQSEVMLNLLKTTLNKTNGSLYNLTLTTANTTQSKFIEVCNDTYMKVSSGAFDYNTAIRQAVKQFADGVQVQYDSGYKLNVKNAVRRAVMTGVNQTCLKMQEERANEMGCDLVEVTAHAGARPEHAEWQGKIYSRSGKSKKYPDLVEATGYGTGPGLGGWNCRHNMFPYFEGTVRTYTDEELEELKLENEENLQNDNENGIMPYIRKNVTSNYDTKNEEKSINSAIDLIRNENKGIANALNKVEFEIINKNKTDKNYSRYDSIQKKIYIYQDTNEYEVIHEIGHFIEDNALKNNYQYQKMKQELINNSIVTKIIRNGEKKFALKNSDFIDEYQGYLHVQNKKQIYINGKVNPERATEIFSESFREYFENRENLKLKLPEFYKMIKELLK